MIHMDYEGYKQVKELYQQVASGISGQAIGLYLTETGRVKKKEFRKTLVERDQAASRLTEAARSLEALWGPEKTNQLILDAERLAMSGQDGVLPRHYRTYVWPKWSQEAGDLNLDWDQITRNQNLRVPYLHLEGETGPESVIIETPPKTPVIMAWDASKGPPEIPQAPKQEEVILDTTATPPTPDQSSETREVTIIENIEDKEEGQSVQTPPPTSSNGRPLPQWLGQYNG